MFQLFRGDDGKLPVLDDPEYSGVRIKIHNIFMARWQYFHTPLFTAAYRFDPEYVRREFSAEEEEEVDQVFNKMATVEHPYVDIIGDLADYEEALMGKQHHLDENVAFSARGIAMAPYKWASRFLKKWPHLCWAVTRLLALACSASGCEHSWSVEAWIHSKKRNRLSQLNVTRLLRAHTNLNLLSQWEDWESKVLPWDIEMICDEPELDE